MNLDHIISTDEDLHREAIAEHVRARAAFDAVKLNILISVVESFHGANEDLREAMIAVNHHANRFIKPLHGQMMSERMVDSTRAQAVDKRTARATAKPVKSYKPKTTLKLG